MKNKIEELKNKILSSKEHSEGSKKVCFGISSQKILEEYIAADLADIVAYFTLNRTGPEDIKFFNIIFDELRSDIKIKDFDLRSLENAVLITFCNKFTAPNYYIAGEVIKSLDYYMNISNGFSRHFNELEMSLFYKAITESPYLFCHLFQQDHFDIVQWNKIKDVTELLINDYNQGAENISLDREQAGLIVIDNQAINNITFNILTVLGIIERYLTMNLPSLDLKNEIHSLKDRIIGLNIANVLKKTVFTKDYVSRLSTSEQYVILRTLYFLLNDKITEFYQYIDFGKFSLNKTGYNILTYHSQEKCNF